MSTQTGDRLFSHIIPLFDIKYGVKFLQGRVEQKVWKLGIFYYYKWYLEACHLIKAQLHSLDFVVNRLFMKLFRINNIKIVKCCQYYLAFNLGLPSVMLAKRSDNFEEK